MSLALVAVLEGALRLSGRPRGRYVAGLSAGLASSGGLWEPGYRARIESGPIPYQLSVNSHGFRGPELGVGAQAAELRIVAIGDSMTEGFYVDDGATYPQQLQLELQGEGVNVEVINAARGGGSIDRFRDILERCVLALDPDIVLITFVSNDLSDLGWFPLEQSAPSLAQRLGSLFVGRSAIGELMLEISLGMQPLDFDRHMADLGEARYRIEGGGEYKHNASLFMQRYAAKDGLVLGSPGDPVAQRAFGIYRQELQRFVELCDAAEIEVLLIYFPSYPDLYVERPASAWPGLLAKECAALGANFVDLTEGLRRASLEEGLGALHLAPLDFHLNPTGNRIVAREVARALVGTGLLAPGELGQ